MITFRVASIPKPKGSMRAFVRGGRPILTSDNPGLKGWEAVVRGEAQRHVDHCAEGEVEVVLHFHLTRPKSHGKALKPHLTKPDVDKLARAVLDALTGVAFRDDSQVVRLEATKRYVGHEQQPGVQVTLWTHGDAPSVPVPSFAHARPALQASDWRPLSALLTPAAVSTAPPAPPAAPRMPPGATRAVAPSAATSAAAPERQGS